MRWGPRISVYCLGWVFALGLSAQAQTPAAFTATGRLHIARQSHTSTPTATLLSNGLVLTVGGYNGGYLASAELFNPATGTFMPFGNLNTARENHTATLLNNGLVLITGGYGSAGYLASAELYNPNTGAFTATGSLNTARQYHTATLLNNGQVLITGGNNGAGYLSSAELYNPATGTFTFTGNLNTARGYNTATLLSNGQVLIAGGYGTTGYLSSAELYSSATGTFTTTGSLNTARQYHTAMPLNTGLVLVAGGYNGSYLTSAELYNPTTGTFAATGSLNTARQYHTAALLNNGSIVIAGGYNGSYLSSAELYNPATGAFTATGSLNTAREYHTSTSLNNGAVLITGGNNNGTYLSSAELYSPASGTFTVTGNSNTARGYYTATLLNSGLVLIAGGAGSSGALSSAELYNPTTGTFTLTGSLNAARFSHTATLLSSGQVLIAGGDGSGYLSSAELYNPTTGTFTLTGSLNTARSSHTATLLNNGQVLVAGGYNGSVLASAELYNPTTGTFTITGNLHTARYVHTSTLLTNGQALIAGGYNGSALASAELYNPTTGTFTVTGNLHTARYNHTSTLLTNGQALIAGGYKSTALASAELYNSATGTFTVTGTLNTARFSHTATLLNDGQALVAGGYNGGALTSAELYNPSTGAFAVTGTLNTARYNHTATLLTKGMVLIAAGNSNTSTYLNSAELYQLNSVAPLIGSLAPSSGSVGTPVTISGTNFGAMQGTSTVTFNGVAAAPTAWSSTSIDVPVPNGATSGNVVVTVGGLPSNGVSFIVSSNPLPLISGLSPDVGQVGTSVTISGSNFGSTQGTSTVTFNETVATPTNWSATSIVVPVPAGATSGNVVVTVGGIASNGVPFIVGSPAPLVTSVSPVSGPPNTVITISGTGFGATQGQSTVTFNGTVATPTNWSATSITVPVPTGATAGCLLVTVGGLASNCVQFNPVSGPSISNVSPTCGAVGTSVTISGANFGTTKGTSTVTFNGTAATPTSWSATNIVVHVPSGATSGNVVVTVSGIASNGVTFTVGSGPCIASLSPTAGPAGTSVTISGVNFGSTKGASTVTFNGVLATPTSWSATSIVVPVPTGVAGECVNVVVTVGGVASNPVQFCVVVSPLISSLSPLAGPVGTPVTIAGANFGSSQGTSTVTFNGVAATPTGWGPTTITVPVPTGATTGLVVVTVGGLSSNGLQFIVGSFPNITGLSPGSGIVGTSVTISGVNFGSSQGSSTVTFNGVAATPTSWSATSIAVPAPTGATTGPVMVTVGGLASNAPIFVVGTGPGITSLSPTVGTVGTSVTISGTNFGSSQGSSTVTFNGTAATPTTWGSSSIVAPVPSGATTGSVVVTVGGVASNGINFAVMLPAPSITSLSPTSGNVGISVTITGTNFGSSQSTSTVTFNGVNATATSWSATSIKATVPAGATTGNVVATVAGQSSNGAVFVVGSGPGITGLNPSSGNVGTSVTISGLNFGSSQGSSTVKFNGMTATVTTWSSTSIVAVVPSGAQNGNVTVTANGITSNGSQFIVSGPGITSIYPTAGPIGSTVSIIGVNFGTTPGTVTFSGNSASVCPTCWSATYITAVVPGGLAVGNATVTVTPAGGGSASTPFVVTPFITSLSLTQGPMGMGFVINGTSFGTSQGTSTVKLSGAPLTLVSWGARPGAFCSPGTCITVQLPAGATPGPGTVVVTVNDQSGNPVPSNPFQFSVVAAFCTTLGCQF